jgi:multiple sugar transport system substrate-binding protein
MAIHLVRSHLAGKLVIATSLATASSLSYGSAMRAITSMKAQGLIVSRPRTPSGKSVSLHPSEKLLTRWHRFAHRASQILGLEVSTPKGCERVKTARRSTIAAYPTILPPPPVLAVKLGLERGLRVLVHADPTFTALRRLRRQFENILGVSIRSRALSIDKLRAEIIANGAARVSKYDVIACDFPWFGEMAAKGLLLPLSDAATARAGDGMDFYPDLLASSRWLGVQYGAPMMMSAEFLVYRTDLFESAGVAPPRTIVETVSAARALHGSSRGLSGIAWNGARGTPLGHTFIMLMGAFGRPVVNLSRNSDSFETDAASGEALRPTFASLEARQTAEFLCEILPFSPPDVLKMDWYDRVVAYRDGRVAMAYSHTMLAPLHEADSSSPAFRRTGYLPHPTGPNGKPILPMGGYALAIPSNLSAPRIKAARVAVQSLTSASAAKLYLLNGSLASPRRSVSRDPEVQTLSPLIGLVHRFAEEGLVRMWPRPPVPGISEIIAVAGQEIHAMLSGQKSIEAALRDCQNRADRAMRALGAY